MALLSKTELIEALEHMGALAAHEGEKIELLLLGGSVMVLAFDARQSTRDVDAIFISPSVHRVRELAARVALERGWPADWLNDAAKGYFVGGVTGPVILSVKGLEARRPSLEQLLAMKLCAWRDDVDISDAKRLMSELHGTPDEIWTTIAKYLQPGREMTARYAFDDLWESLHGAP
jgi:hypothetical protein